MHPHSWRRQLIGYLVTGAALMLVGRGDRQDGSAASIPTTPALAGAGSGGMEHGIWREVTSRLHAGDDLLPMPVPGQ